MDITKLECWSDWFRWKQDVMNVIIIYGFEDLLKRDTRLTIGDEETQSAFEARLELWEDRQEQVVAIVSSSLGILVRDHVKDKTTLSEVMDAVNTWFQIYKNLAFRVLYHQYESLTLDDCANVAEYAEKLLEPFFIHKFLSGLGGNYETFLILFHLKHSLIPERQDGKIIKHAVTFEEAVDVAQQYELIKKPRGVNLGATSMRSREACQHYHKPGRLKERCWFLHPELRAEAVKRRRRKIQTRMQ
ncbi:hypothetical protein V8C34DRAFT_319213 [Trichoderma compactum]